LEHHVRKAMIVPSLKGKRNLVGRGAKSIWSMTWQGDGGEKNQSGGGKIKISNRFNHAQVLAGTIA